MIPAIRIGAEAGSGTLVAEGLLFAGPVGLPVGPLLGPLGLLGGSLGVTGGKSVPSGVQGGGGSLLLVVPGFEPPPVPSDGCPGSPPSWPGGFGVPLSPELLPPEPLLPEPPPFEPLPPDPLLLEPPLPEPLDPPLVPLLPEPEPLEPPEPLALEAPSEAANAGPVSETVPASKPERWFCPPARYDDGRPLIWPDDVSDGDGAPG
jgi:protein TonB